ncbi:AAA family ATPase [Pseudomonas fluorescens]|uniref:AAA family ATPase n=1 Tax=Pseudomonas fluorescens TaxID=294 RepID=UPI0037FF8B97
MEYDESREFTRLIAQEMLSVGTSFPKISPERVTLLAALHLTKGLILPRQFQDMFEDSSSAVIEMGLKDFDDIEIRSAFNTKLKHMKDLDSRPMDSEMRIKVATHLIDLYIMDSYGIPYDYPLATAGLVGSIHATLRSSIIEVNPSTAELSMGKERTNDSSYPMVYPAQRMLKCLISLKLLINNIRPNFVDDGIQNAFFDDQPSFLWETYTAFAPTVAHEINDGSKFILNYYQAARFMLVVPARSFNQVRIRKELAPALATRLRLDAVISFSVSQDRDDNNDQLLLIFSQGIHLMRKPRLYIDVSLNNKSLGQLDLQERAILAGHIFNIHESRDLDAELKSTPSKVTKIINAQFSSGYHNVKTLCMEEDVDLGKPLKVHSPRNFIRTNHIEGSTFNTTADPQGILKLLSNATDPVCIYIIGNNGAGKTRLLCELIDRIGEMDRRTVGISTGVHDRFPLGRKSQHRNFKYKGVRSSADSISPSKLTKTTTSLIAQALADQRMLEALKECQQCLGFATRFYFMLKPEMALYNNPRDIRLIRMSDNAADNYVPEPLSHYEFGVVRPETEEQRERIVSYSSLSSGEQNINQLLLSIITTAERGTVFLVDEPEISLHLKWQQTLPRVFHLLSQRFGCSFVVATHAPTLISNANDRGSHSFLLDVGKLPELNEKQRYSVESIILGGFGTYTPHNRAVHEACARIVAKTMESKGRRQAEPFAPLTELNDMLEKMRFTQGAYVPPGQQEDIDLINKAYTAVQLLLQDQGQTDNATTKAGA